MAILDLTAFAEQGVRLVEQQNRSTLFGGIEHKPEVLFCFSDVLAHHLAQVDAVQVESQFVCQHLSRHRLARAAGASEQRADAEAASALGCESPLIVDLWPPPDVSGDIAQSLTLGLGQHEIVPGRRRLYALAQVVQACPSLGATGIPERGSRRAFVSSV